MRYKIKIFSLFVASLIAFSASAQSFLDFQVRYVPVTDSTGYLTATDKTSSATSVKTEQTPVKSKQEVAANLASQVYELQAQFDKANLAALQLRKQIAVRAGVMDTLGYNLVKLMRTVTFNADSALLQWSGLTFKCAVGKENTLTAGDNKFEYLVTSELHVVISKGSESKDLWNVGNGVYEGDAVKLTVYPRKQAASPSPSTPPAAQQPTTKKKKS